MGLTKIKVAGNESFIGMSHDSIHHWLLTSYLKMTMIIISLYFQFLMRLTHYDYYDNVRDVAAKHRSRVS